MGFPLCGEPVSQSAWISWRASPPRLMAVPCDGAASPWQQRALTAAFIVDFAEAAQGRSGRVVKSSRSPWRLWGGVSRLRSEPAQEVGLPCLSMPPTQQVGGTVHHEVGSTEETCTTPTVLHNTNSFTPFRTKRLSTWLFLTSGLTVIARSRKAS